MRKSNLTKTEKYEAKKKRNGRIMGLFIVAIMVFAVFGTVFSFNPNGLAGSGQTIEEFGLTFRVVNVDGQQLWQTTIDGQTQNFFFLPSQVALYTVEDSILQTISQSPYVGISLDAALLQDPQYVGTYIELQSAIPQDKLTVGLTVDDGQSPVVTCDQASEQYTVIAPVLGNGTTTIDTNCVSLVAFTTTELFYTSEYIKYSLLGVDFNEQ